jgi:hypothetical protein
MRAARRKGRAMKLIRTRVGVLVASCGLLASASALTVITVSPTATGIVSGVSAAGVPSSTRCPNATVIEAGQCK